MSNGLPDWIDVSNFSQPFTAEQLAFLQQNNIGVCIGIQNTAKAKAFLAQVLSIGVPFDFYADKARRDFSFCPAGSMIWEDVETGCMTTRAEVNEALAKHDAAGLDANIYGNYASIFPVIGDSDEWSLRRLWYANYPSDHHVPTAAEFSPFNGWTMCEGWQYSTLGIAGINCDLDVEIAAPQPPAPQPDYVTHFTQRFASGTVWEMDVVKPPGAA